METWLAENAPPPLPADELLVELLEAGNSLAEIVGGQLSLDPGETAHALERWSRVVIRAAVIHQTQGGTE